MLTRGPQERLFLCLQILGSQELRSSGYNTFGSKKVLRSLCGRALGSPWVRKSVMCVSSGGVSAGRVGAGRSSDFGVGTSQAGEGLWGPESSFVAEDRRTCLSSCAV